MTAGISETVVREAWRYCLSQRAEFTTEDSEIIRVVYPGRWNGRPGPDVIDAIIDTGHGRQNGHFELHVRSSDWESHNHRENPAYDDVILHITMWHDTGRATFLHSGKTVPVIALHRVFADVKRFSESEVKSPVPGAPPCRDVLTRSDGKTTLSLLESAGETRFLNKSGMFLQEFAAAGPDDALYRGVMNALGYSGNEKAFRELARKTPLKMVNCLTPGNSTATEYLARVQALFFGNAGLLPSQRSPPESFSEPYVASLEKTWESLPHGDIMSKTGWCFSALRPCNSPHRRVAAMSYLLLRYRESGMAAVFADKLGQLSPHETRRELEALLTVKACGYWAHHCNFDNTCAEYPSLLGKDRAAEIMVNIILPFAHALGRHSGKAKLAAKSIECYRHHPRLLSNALERHMCRQLGISGRMADSARRQQGLIHIYKTLCTRGKCGECPLRP